MFVGTVMNIWVLSRRFVFVWVCVFPEGGVRFLAEVIGQGLLLVLDVASSGINSLGGVEAWVLIRCQCRKVRE